MTRTGHGVDAHPFGGTPPLVIAGVVVDSDRGLIATSDGDVAVHALMDALLGAVALGDLGSHFPDDEPSSQDADSLQLLHKVCGLVRDHGYSIVNADLTVVSQDVRIAPHRDAMRAALADVMAIDISQISVKATTTDGLGFVGRGEGIAALATAAVSPTQA